jgi:pseudouridine-5'-phosphate glycosidase
MRAGIQISKIRKQKVRDAIILIFHGSKLLGMKNKNVEKMSREEN